MILESQFANGPSESEEELKNQLEKLMKEITVLEATNKFAQQTRNELKLKEE